MKNFLHKSLSFVLVITLVLSLFSGLSFQSGALSSSGHCGYQVTYTFNSSSGLLIISGSGYIGEDEVGTPYDTPFKGDDSIKTVVINSGVKRVGDEAFMCCSGLENITIPDSVISIGYNAFYNSGLYTSQSNWENGVLYIDNHLIRAEADVSASYQIKPNTKTIASDAFYYCNELTSVTIPNSVTSIGECAFEFCIGLTNITIPNSVTSIGRQAFHGCSGLKNVTIPSSVTRMGFNVFSDCSQLKTAGVIGSGCDYQFGWLTSIPATAFSGCSSLTSITVPDSVTSIGNYAFSGCSSLTSITIPDAVANIGHEMFYNCSGLKELTMPASAKIFNSELTFYNCTGIEKVTLTKGTGMMQDYASSSDSSNTYYRYTPWYISRNNLTVLVLEDGITNIGSYVFNGCSELTSAKIPDSIENIRENAFYGCSGLKELTMPASAKNSLYTFSGCNNIEKVLLTKGTGIMQNYANTYYASDTYYNSTPWHISYKLKELVLEEGITNIGNYAFSGCSNLTSITIPDSVTSIGNSAFSGCSGITCVTIPDSVTSIGNGAFADCNSLTSITIPNSVTSFEPYIFRNSGLTSINIPDSVESIGDYAFYNCNGLKELTMPVSAIIFNSEFTFYNCTGIEKVSLTKGTGTMQDFGTDSSSSAKKTYYQYTPWYQSRSNFKELVIEDGVENIGNYAFCDCSRLTSITIPADMCIDFTGFNDCTNLQTINLTAGKGKMADWSDSYADSLWYLHKDTIREISLEEGIENISESAFYGCSNLIKTNVPTSVKSIGRYAYYGCSNLRNITILSPKCEILGNENTIDKFATIYGFNNSTAQQYAQKYDRDFVSLGDFVCLHKNVVTDKAVAPTCTKTGLTEGTHCAYCLAVLVEQETIPALGHAYQEQITKNATCTDSGEATYTCEHCGDSYTENISALGHTPTAAVKENEVAATCTAAGSYDEVIKCSVCGTEISRKTVAVAMNSHIFVNTKIVKPTTVKAGYTDQKCSVCDATRRVCTAPTGVVKTVKCKARTAAAETIYWSAIKGAEGYQIQVSNAAGNAWDKTYNAKIKTSYTIKSLAAGGIYKFRVRIYAKGVDGKWTYGAWTKAITSPTLPSGTSITKVTGGSKSFTAQWKQNKTVTGYQVQYSLKSNFSGAKAVTVKSNKTLKTTVKKLSAKKVYYVRIRTYKTIAKVNYFSTWSKAVKVKTK